MAIAQIPLDGGLVTQADAEEVGINACTVLINLEFDKLGMIYKRKGRGASVSVGANINEMSRWISTAVEPDVAYWVICDTLGRVYITDDLGTLGSSIFDSSGTRVRVSNYGSMLRFANGVGFDPKVYQYISRTYYWGALVVSPAYFSSRAYPENEFVTLVKSGKLDTDYSSSMGHTTKVYQYKITYVYDGNQETPLPILTTTNSKNVLDGTVITDDTHVYSFEALHVKGIWSNRITGLNIYRREGSGLYYKVNSVSTLDTDKDLNLQRTLGGVVTNVIVDSASGIPSTATGQQLYIKGIKHAIGTWKNSQFASMNVSVDANVGNTWGTFTGYTDLQFDNDNSGTVMTPVKDNDTGGWFIGNLPGTGGDYALTGVYDADGTFAGNWADSTGTHLNCAQNTNATYAKYGSNSLEFSATASGIATMRLKVAEIADPSGTGFLLTDTVMVAFWFKLKDSGLTNDKWEVNIGIVDGGSAVGAYDTGGGAGPKTVMQYIGDSTIGAGDKFRYCQAEIPLSTMSSTLEDDDYVVLEVRAEDVSGGELYIDNLIVCKKIYNTATGKLGYGSDVVASTGLDLGAEDSAIGYVSQIGGVSSDIHTIKKNYQYAYQNSVSGLGASASQTVHVNRSYAWKNESSLVRFHYRDLDDTNGAVHPTGETSLAVNFTYSVNLEGRQYVAGVSLNPSAENEIHDDWVLFSELSQPDVIPITNYIAIPDMQGGKINGLAKLIGDLVVLQSKGIYRISIPSADPTGWSLSESEPNIGCVAPDSIVEHDAGVFFAGIDHMYHLGANFQAIPITTSIKDVYQGISSLENTSAIIDVKKNRLLCKFGSMYNTVYSLDLTKMAQGIEHWSVIYLTSTPNIDLFTIDENSQIHTIDAGATSTVSELDPSSSTETVLLQRKTGWVSFGDLDTSGVLRRLNMRYTSTEVITLKIYADGDTSTAVKTISIPANNTSSTDWYKCKPSVRCRYFMVELFTSVSATEVDIQRLEVEFE